MKQIELITHIKANNIALINIELLNEKWFVIIHTKQGNPSAAALRTARGEVKMFAQIDSLVKFIRSDCEWKGELQISAIK